MVMFNTTSNEQVMMFQKLPENQYTMSNTPKNYLTNFTPYIQKHHSPLHSINHNQLLRSLTVKSDLKHLMGVQP